MKKVVTLALSLAITFGAGFTPGLDVISEQMSITASAAVFADYEYEILNDGTVSLTKYKGTSSEIVIPETIDAKAVTVIKSDAFSNLEQQKSVSVPSGVKIIGDHAFGYKRTQNGYEKISTFMVLCYEGSAAQKYAEQNEFEYDIIKCDHSVEKWVTTKEATCSQEGTQSGYCSKCKLQVSRSIPIDKNAHKFTGWSTAKPSTPISDGQMSRSCLHCGKTETQTIARATQRIYGSNRYETAFKIADTLKANNGNKKFPSVIVASGLDSADALSAAYLAKVRNAPLLITAPADVITDRLVKYIGDNAEENATVYIIGGTKAVSQQTQDKLKNYNVVRVSGPDRYLTNLLVLKEAGVTNQELLVASGINYADALSASAVGKPILLVNGKTLNSNQRSFIGTLSGTKATIIGGKVAVSDDIQTQLKGIYTSVSRIGGANRYETSVNVASKYFSKPKTMVLAYGMNFPDGLCGGPLAMSYNSPLILTADNATAQARNYALKSDINYVAILGGTGLISNNSVMMILSSPATAKTDGNSITLKWNTVKGASLYRISTISPDKKIIAVTDKLSYTVKGAAATSYTFCVDALSADGNVVAGSKTMVAAAGTAPETVKSLSASSNAASTVLSWSSVKCSYYQIFKLISGRYDLIGTSTTNSYSDTRASGSNNNEYKVRAVFVNSAGNAYYGGYSPSAKIVTNINQAPNMLLSESGEHYIKLKWEKQYGVSSYRVSIYKDGQWRSYTTNANSYTFNRLERSTRYNFKVCGIINAYSTTKEAVFSDATDSTIKSKTAFRIYASANTSSAVLYYGQAGVVLTQKGKYSSSWYRVYVPGTNNTSIGYVQASQFGGYMNLNFGPISQLGWEGGSPLPTGCETTALATQLNRGLKLPCTKNLLADKYLTILPNYVGDPNYASWGNPYTDYGYGVMAPALAETTNKYLKSIGVRDQYQIDVHTDNNKNMCWYKLDTGSINTSDGLDLEGIKHELELGHSLVIWWITRGNDPSSYTNFTINRGERYTHDGTGTYTLTWVAHQHGSVITGYDETTNQFIIADVGWGFTVRHSFSHFMKIYTLQNRQSLVIYKKL